MCFSILSKLHFLRLACSRPSACKADARNAATRTSFFRHTILHAKLQKKIHIHKYMDIYFTFFCTFSQIFMFYARFLSSFRTSALQAEGYISFPLPPNRLIISYYIIIHIFFLEPIVLIPHNRILISLVHP